MYRITARGIQWVIPQGMRHAIVTACHDDLGHFSVEKTLYWLREHYWFPRMRGYVIKYISLCIQCLYNKGNSGREEGFLHSIQRAPEPFNMLHLDHLGPFPVSRKKNYHLIVLVDGFTKFVFLKAVKTTKAKYLVQFLVFSVVVCDIRPA